MDGAMDRLYKLCLQVHVSLSTWRDNFDLGGKTMINVGLVVMFKCSHYHNYIYCDPLYLPLPLGHIFQ